MIYVLLSHPIQDFDAWKPVFESDQARAKAAGLQIINVLRSAEDPNDVSIFCTAPSHEAFHAFVSDPVLPELMKQAGVLAPPTIRVFTAA